MVDPPESPERQRSSPSHYLFEFLQAVKEKRWDAADAIEKEHGKEICALLHEITRRIEEEIVD